MNGRGRGCSSDGENRQAPTMQAASHNEEMAQLVMWFCRRRWVICWTAQRPFFPSPVWEKTNLSSGWKEITREVANEEVKTFKMFLGPDSFALTVSVFTSNSWFTSALCSTSKSATHRLMLGAICKVFWEKSMLCPLQMRVVFFFSKWLLFHIQSFNKH